MSAIESNRYRETREALAKDPIIQDMAKEMVEAFKNPDFRNNIMTNDGSPKWGFMQTCLDEYHKRGGKVNTHIGGPAQVVIKILLGERP